MNPILLDFGKSMLVMSLIVVVIWRTSKFLKVNPYFAILGFGLMILGAAGNAVAMYHNNNMMPVLWIEGFGVSEDEVHYAYYNLDEVNLPILTDFIPSRWFVYSIGDIFIVGGFGHILGAMCFLLIKAKNLSKIYKPETLDKNYKELIYK